MSLRYAIDLLAMLACSVYCTIPLFWLVVHPFIDRWRRRGRRAYALILPVWAVFIAGAFAILWPFRLARYYTTWAAWVPAAFLFWTGFSIYSAAFKKFDRVQVSGLAELGTGSTSARTGDERNPRACAASDLSRTSVRDSGLVCRDWTDRALCAGRIRDASPARS